MPRLPPQRRVAGWRDAVKPAKEGVALDVDVVPGSRESRFPAGYNAWRARIEAKVRAPPEEGQANAELCALVADALGIPVASVRVTSGHTSRRKTLHAGGLTRAAALAALEGTLDRADDGAGGRGGAGGVPPVR